MHFTLVMRVASDPLHIWTLNVWCAYTSLIEYETVLSSLGQRVRGVIDVVLVRSFVLFGIDEFIKKLWEIVQNGPFSVYSASLRSLGKYHPISITTKWPGKWVPACDSHLTLISSTGPEGVALIMMKAVVVNVINFAISIETLRSTTRSTQNPQKNVGIDAFESGVVHLV